VLLACDAVYTFIAATLLSMVMALDKLRMTGLLDIYCFIHGSRTIVTRRA
jgi:hypothetical protein